MSDRPNLTVHQPVCLSNRPILTHSLLYNAQLVVDQRRSKVTLWLLSSLADIQTAKNNLIQLITGYSMFITIAWSAS